MSDLFKYPFCKYLILIILALKTIHFVCENSSFLNSLEVISFDINAEGFDQKEGVELDTEDENLHLSFIGSIPFKSKKNRTSFFSAPKNYFNLFLAYKTPPPEFLV